MRLASIGRASACQALGASKRRRGERSGFDSRLPLAMEVGHEASRAMNDLAWVAQG